MTTTEKALSDKLKKVKAELEARLWGIKSSKQAFKILKLANAPSEKNYYSGKISLRDEEIKYLEDLLKKFE